MVMKMGKKSWAALAVLTAGLWGCNGLAGADPPIPAEDGAGGNGAGGNGQGGAGQGGDGQSGGAGQGGDGQSGGAGQGGDGQSGGAGQGGDGQGGGAGQGGDGQGGGAGQGGDGQGGAAGSGGGCNPQDGTGCVCIPGTATPCYTGPAGTEGIGICQAGAQTCADDGLGYGPCNNEQLPQTEVCDAAKLDEDCDGQVNEGALSCTCGDGAVDPGEQCDDGDMDSTDGCTSKCKLPACGDGFLQKAAGEQCDDGGVADGDICSPTCKEQKVIQVEAGDSHVCALLSHGKVKCWGNFQWLGIPDGGGQNNRGDSPGEMGANLPEVNLGTGAVAVKIAAGSNHTCALLDDGKVKCWGANSAGQLGLGDTNNRGLLASHMGDNLKPVDLGGGKKATSITAGRLHTCAIREDGLVKCWGANGKGQLGLGDTTNRLEPPVAAVKLGSALIVAEVSAGGDHTCARFTNGKVKCWGGNAYGQLGLGDTKARGDEQNEMGDALAFVKLGTDKKATSISAGFQYTCVALDDGKAKCWGRNDSGQLGRGSTKTIGDEAGEMGDNLDPIVMGPNTTVVAVLTATGDGLRHHACARLQSGYVKCWGANNRGQLGQDFQEQLGDEANEMGVNLDPVKLQDKKVASISLGASKLLLQNDNGDYVGSGYTCAVFIDSSAKCWGNSAYGMLGKGNTFSLGNAPGEMAALTTVKLFSSAW
jgi:cysteine-rich repeat protein